MSVWVTEAVELVGRILGSPANMTDWTIVGGASLVAAVLAMNLVGRALGLTNVGGVLRFVALVVGLFLLIAAASASSLLIVPRISHDAFGLAALIAVPVLVMLLVAVPLMAWMVRAKYMETLITFFCSLIVCVVIAHAAAAVVASVRGGRKESGRIHRRREAVENMLEN